MVYLGRDQRTERGESVRWRRGRQLGLWCCSALGGLAMAGIPALSAIAQIPNRQTTRQPPRELLTQLDEAICLNQWGEAIELTGAMLALPQLPQAYRFNLVSFREELMRLQAFGTVIPRSSSCDRALALTLSVPDPIAAQANADDGFDWSRGIDAVTQGSRPVVVLDPTPNDLVNSPIPLALLDEGPAVFADAIPLDTRDGFSVIAGAVTPSRQQTYAFVARLGDRVTLDLDVTRIAVDAGITGEDSHLFLFDRTGQLITENDDADGRQSRIDQAVVVDTQVHYVVVTSHNNLPLLDAENRLVGWTGTGVTQFDYTLTLTGATPSRAILR